MHVYLSPEHAGRSTATLVGWDVDDIEAVVDELISEGVRFEHYDEPGLRTDAKGIATFEGEAKVAYFKDPDGNTLSIAQAPTRSPRSPFIEASRREVQDFRFTEFSEVRTRHLPMAS